MKRSASSRRWLDEHHNDDYVKRAKAAGYRSRAAFKLLELNERDKFIKLGMRVVDLGAAPGGWSQVAAQLVGTKGRVLATDILPMEPLPGVEVVTGDFTEQKVVNQICAELNEQPVDVVLSDMAPNLSGVKVADQAKAIYLLECAVDFAYQVLGTGGCLAMKVFQGAGIDELRTDLRSNFDRILVRKPKASRDRSKEVYWIADGFKGGAQ